MEPLGEPGEIIEDRGPATSGGASKTQRVLVRSSDGTEWDAHAKFAQDTSGQILAENGAHGLAAELLASRLGQRLSASVPPAEPVMLAPGVVIRLRNGETPAPGLALAAHSIDLAVDVTPGTLPADVDPKILAGIAALHSVVEARDRGHNLVISHGRPYSVDHATAFGPAWDLKDSSGSLMLDPLIEPILSKHPTELRAAGRGLGKLSDADIDELVGELPRDWVPSDEQRDRLSRNVKDQRDRVIDGLNAAADEYDRRPGSP
jgi:hypothetical protein